MTYINQIKFRIFILFFTFSGVINTSAQTFQWAKRMGGIDDEHGRCVTVDGSGNVITTGRFEGTADFDPGTGTANLTSAGQGDIHIVKLTSAGNFLWAKRIGSSTNDEGWGVGTDATGNVYVSGGFSGTCDFDPGAGTFNMTALGGEDIFVCKFSSAGNFIWAKQAGSSTGGDVGLALEIDGAGNVHVTGRFNGTADFDPGAAIYNMVSAGSMDVFLWKLTTAGNFIWAKRMGGTSYDEAHGISLDGSGNVYTTGVFFGTVDFDPGTGVYNLTATGAIHAFISKISSAGNFVWARAIGGNGYDLSVDASGNVYTTGVFMGTFDFDPGTAVYNLTSVGSVNNIFISKLNTAGNFVWAKRIGGTGGQYAQSIETDAAGNSYITGYFATTVDFDPGTGVYNHTSAQNATFILKLNTTGNYLWSYAFPGTGYNAGFSIFVDAAHNVYFTGTFEGSADFNPGTGVSTLTSAGGNEIFIVKLSQPSPLPIELLTFEATQIKNVVEITWQTATETNNDYFTIEKSKDGNEFEEVAKLNGEGNSTTVLSYSFTDKNPYSGVSYYRLKQTDFNGEFSYSKTVVVKLDGKQSNQFVIYQNSLLNTINIAFANSELQACNLKVHDMAGSVVYERQMTSANTIINSAFAPGMYVAIVTNVGQAFTQKFIIK